MCDIEKMFHQFYVQPADRNYLRFLWWEEGDTNKQPQAYRMRVHPFGATSSPGCANFGLKYLAQMHEEKYPIGSEFICQSFNVDDGVTSVESVDKAIKLSSEACALCSLGNIRLHKFVSNDDTVLESIPVNERAAKKNEIPLNGDVVAVERTLGIKWKLDEDQLIFQVQLKERPDTRRGILSTIASIYDPLGLLSPFVLLGKTILQEICKKGLSWDDELPDELWPRWERWKADMVNLKSLEISRCYKPTDFGPVKRIELHHFSDASTEGYGACSYLRFIGDNKACTTLVLAKARVSPTKVTTVPRLELTAAVIAVKLGVKIKKELSVKVDGEFYWTDSKVTIAYITNDTKRFHVFVANRVEFIRSHTGVKQWQYVSTSVNPADHASRGLLARELGNSNWFTGPDFLQEINYIIGDNCTIGLPEDDPEVKAQTFSIISKKDNQEMVERLNRFSDWGTMIRAVARIRRLKYSMPGNPTLTVQEISQAEHTILRLVQNVSFGSEILSLSTRKGVSTDGSLYNLDPFLQEDLIRVRGRLGKSALEMNVKHPVLLPKEGHITQLIVAYYHRKILHQGRTQTLNAIRSHGYWIIGGSKVVAHAIKNCVYCRRLRRPAEEQRMSDLPEDRVEPSPPFSFCGMDCFGPYVTKMGRKNYKRYGLLLTCMCSRAVHIEMLEDLSTDSFINGLRSFIAIRGAVTQIRSDQGTNFIGASNELEAALKELDRDRITTYLIKKQCEFIFNPPCSSHRGGVWERQIRTIKSVLNATVALCPGRLDDASLRTFFYEAMSVVNSRPITTLSSDPANEPLTPNHLITMKPSIPLPPPGTFVKEDLYAKKRWRRVQYLSDQFFSRWRREYLLNFTHRQKWSKIRRNVKVGDIVLLTDGNTPRMEWPRAIVIEAKFDEDGLVRSVRLRLGTSYLDNKGRRQRESSILERPIQKIVVISEAE